MVYFLLFFFFGFSGDCIPVISGSRPTNLPCCGLQASFRFSGDYLLYCIYSTVLCEHDQGSVLVQKAKIRHEVRSTVLSCIAKGSIGALTEAVNDGLYCTVLSVKTVFCTVLYCTYCTMCLSMYCKGSPVLDKTGDLRGSH